jgi:hypothetical protein
MLLERSNMAKSRIHRRTHRTGRNTADVEALPRNYFPAKCAQSDEGSNFIDQTLAVWQSRTARPLSREDGREIIENMTGFFRILQEWERAERANGAK